MEYLIAILKTTREIFLILVPASIVALYIDRKQKTMKGAKQIFFLSVLLTAILTIVIIALRGEI